MPGLLALAVAMGIGRFAFTPLLPMMQADAGVGVAQGGWLASANYLGYFVGAVAAMRLPWRAGTVVRGALVLVALTTAAMALTSSLAAWIGLRFAAGVASAWVLVFVSAWGFERPPVVFSGVGIGIAATGLACLVLMARAAASSTAWFALGGAAMVLAALLWRSFPNRETTAGSQAAAPLAWTPEARRLVLCYGAFGFGYIVPATFLPVMAKQAMDDPALFGWSWPVFGAAAAASTFVAGRLRRAATDRSIWIASHGLMALGVALSAPWPGLPPGATIALVIAAGVLVGGTFMVITMVGMQEARRVAGAASRPLIAAMTSAFAAGQIAGPLVVSAAGGFAFALALAAAALVASALILRRNP